jgi:hypothetical protein
MLDGLSALPAEVLKRNLPEPMIAFVIEPGGENSPAPERCSGGNLGQERAFA